MLSLYNSWILPKASLMTIHGRFGWTCLLHDSIVNRCTCWGMLPLPWAVWQHRWGLSRRGWRKDSPTGLSEHPEECRLCLGVQSGSSPGQKDNKFTITQLPRGWMVQNIGNPVLCVESQRKAKGSLPPDWGRALPGRGQRSGSSSGWWGRPLRPCPCDQTLVYTLGPTHKLRGVKPEFKKRLLMKNGRRMGRWRC